MAEAHEVPEYIPGDHVELSILLRHKHNVVAVEAGFAHETSSDVTFARRNAPELERRESDEKVSTVHFAPMRVTTQSPLGEYRCTYLYAYYPTTEGQPQRGANLSVPQGLRFRIVEEPTDPPEVTDWSWIEPDQESDEEPDEDPDEESNGQQDQQKDGDA